MEKWTGGRAFGVHTSENKEVQGDEIDTKTLPPLTCLYGDLRMMEEDKTANQVLRKIVKKRETYQQPLSVFFKVEMMKVQQIKQENTFK